MKWTQAEYEQAVSRIDATKGKLLRANSAGGALSCVVVETPMTLSPSTDVAKLNKTERAFHCYLHTCTHDWLGVQNMTFKLADDCRFTPDFNVLTKGKLVCYDVKGFQREDALIKIKVAARMFPWVTFAIVKKEKDGWDMMVVKP